MRSRESEEMYLETILLMEEKLPYIRRVDIAAELGYSKPSISNAVKQLKSKGMVREEHGFLFLTEAGRQAAAAVYEKHHLLTKLLVKIGVSPSVAEDNACRMEHVISPELMEAIRKFVNDDKERLVIETLCG